MNSYFLGASSLSDFRLAALNRALSAQGLQLKQSRYVYLADWSGEVNEAALATLLETDQALPSWEEQIFIAPRVGTVSPWSSKATDIARVCGLSGLARVEQGRTLELAGWSKLDAAQRKAALANLHDPLTEAVFESADELSACFAVPAARPLQHVVLGDDPQAALRRSNVELGLALAENEIDYLAMHYAALQRDPTDAELMMFAQINSEHCRHKIFNAAWKLDGQEFEHSLFDMIRMTYAATPEGILSAYSDNAAVLDAQETQRFVPNADGVYEPLNEAAAIAIKVETHNHPTAIAPDPGAATGAGGEIRDEAATGRGGKPKAGLCGFSVGDLNIPALPQAWENKDPVPARLASSLDIMLDGPIGAARYNNEFGRPNLTGYFRTMDVQRRDRRWGYAKPIMIAGGLGAVRPQHAQKLKVPPGSLVVILGGPGMLIGLGGGAASSLHAGASSEDLDFASVQRANPELERRCQEVIDACWSQGENNPILSIHDVGAGGISNAVPEILHDNGLGGDIDLGKVLIADPSLSPMEIWCNESQERYVIAIAPESLEGFTALCERERCPFAVIGVGTEEPHLRVRAGEEMVVDLPMDVLLGKQPRMQREASTLNAPTAQAEWTQDIALPEALDRVLQLPAVASKNFLITIGDRSVSGLVCRDQMVGPWQVPVADVAVTAAGYDGPVGEAMAMGERSSLAISHPAASGRMAVAEAITNLAAAPVEKLTDVRLSANWMAAAGDAEQSSALLETVEAVGKEFCPELGLAIPVGKDSLSMQTRWEEQGEQHDITAPVSLVISAFAPVTDVAKVATPQLRLDQGDSVLIMLDVSDGQTRLGGSALAQVYGVDDGLTPDVEKPASLKALFDLVQQLRGENKLLAYHDRSDGGFLVAALEMAFAARCGLRVQLAADEGVAELFTEEAGALIQVREEDEDAILALCAQQGLAARSVAQVQAGQSVQVYAGERCLLDANGRDLQQTWAETSYHMQTLRDEPGCAQEEFEQIADENDPGLHAELSFTLEAPAIVGSKPKVAVLREQGVNGQVEMAWMFDRAGFEAVDVHMSDILSGRRSLEGFKGLAACGGFSYGDVLGAGRGWAKTILLNPQARAQFENFFADSGHFALGVCNGCQMLASLAELIPGTEHWPQFVRNRSEQFEARLAMVEVSKNNSVMLSGMAGSRLPLVVAHGEGRAEFKADADLAALQNAEQVNLRYIDNYGAATQRFPQNPNGSPQGVTGISNADGRVTIMMPHPERLTRAASFSWAPDEWTQSPWLQMFYSARRWLA